jgi:beta-galactosidase
MQVDYSGKSAKSDSNDVLFIYAKIVDEKGTIVPLNDQNVHFNIEGDAQLVSPEVIITESGIATALVRVGTGRKPIIIKANLNKLASEISITVE